MECSRWCPNGHHEGTHRHGLLRDFFARRDPHRHCLARPQHSNLGPVGQAAGSSRGPYRRGQNRCIQPRRPHAVQRRRRRLCAAHLGSGDRQRNQEARRPHRRIERGRADARRQSRHHGLVGQDPTHLGRGERDHARGHEGFSGRPAERGDLARRQHDRQRRRRQDGLRQGIQDRGGRAPHHAQRTRRQREGRGLLLG